MNLWNHPDIPHKGWILNDYYSNEHPEHKCEMCGQEDIIHVFVMKHKEANLTLEVGCVCAEKMLNDYINPKKYKAFLINWKKRRKNWPNLKWYNTMKGNIDIKKDGNHVVIYTNNTFHGYKLLINNQFGKKEYNSVHDAKMAAFDYLYPRQILLRS